MDDGIDNEELLAMKRDEERRKVERTKRVMSIQEIQAYSGCFVKRTIANNSSSSNIDGISNIDDNSNIINDDEEDVHSTR